MASTGTVRTGEHDLRQQRRAEEQDAQLRRDLGPWSLTAAGVGSVIGSGWLFAAMYGARFAGPAALVSFLVGGGLMLMIALVFAELGMVRPESGGLVRYPLYSNGRLAASIVGWAMWLSYVGNPPVEASATVQYASIWLPGVFSDDRLTGWGIVLTVAIMAVYVVVNCFGVALFARTNNIVTAVKVLIPTLTIVLLLASGFGHGGGRNFTAYGGFAPYGLSASLGAIASAGLVFAYTGFRNVIELSGEARNPRRDVPRAMVGTILLAIVLYLGLQVAFIVAVPADKLGGGWHGIDLTSPFADLAVLLGLTWLSWTLVADSVLSPSGSGIIFTAANGRNVFGLGKNGFFPRWLMQVGGRWGVPTRALLFNFLVGIAFLLPLPSWQKIVAVLSVMAAFTFSIGSVSLWVFRNVGLGDARARLAGMRVIAPGAFMVSSLVIFWEPSDELLKTVPIVVVGMVWYLGSALRGHGHGAEVAAGAWLVVFLAFIYAMSVVGSFGGSGLVPGPWDGIVVAIVSLALYLWGVRAGTAYLGGRPDLLELLSRRREDEVDGGGAARGADAADPDGGSSEISAPAS